MGAPRYLSQRFVLAALLTLGAHQAGAMDLIQDGSPVDIPGIYSVMGSEAYGDPDYSRLHAYPGFYFRPTTNNPNSLTAELGYPGYRVVQAPLYAPATSVVSYGGPVGVAVPVQQFYGSPTQTYVTQSSPGGAPTYMHVRPTMSWR
uniref:Uncharacterized protein n=1 Tax=Magnetococcus massalia (strain MO-1) TaxID=451514 RepID=A0A1S7LJ97_MAGMO|nr:exported protein of unknown function [Candidatus Magnetococcus massalia]